MNETISVIIPVYNVASYLPQCLDSVLNQDYTDLEVLLIDDGSTDASGGICDAYAARDSRIQVIHQENAGAAAAKNAGLRAATGAYLSFVDSDDYLEPNAYGYMVETLKATEALAVQFSFREVYCSHSEDQCLPQGRSVFSHKDYLVRFTKDWSCALLWNKLYRREIFEGIFFEEGHKIDDEYFTYQGFLNPGTVVRDDRIIYNYRRRASSVMATPQAACQRVLDCLDATVKRREKVVARYPELKKAFDENYLDTLWYLSGNEGGTAETIETLKEHLKAYFLPPKNSFPPRYLWPMLLKLAIAPTSKLLEECKKTAEAICVEDHFA